MEEVINKNRIFFQKILLIGFVLIPILGPTVTYAQYTAGGYDFGYTAGFEPGYTAGFESEYTAGFEIPPITPATGYSAGYEPGYTTGFEPGYTAGFAPVPAPRPSLAPVVFAPASFSGFAFDSIGFFPGTSNIFLDTVGFRAASPSPLSLPTVSSVLGSSNISLNPVSFSPASPSSLSLSPVSPALGSSNIVLTPVSFSPGSAGFFGLGTVGFSPGSSFFYGGTPVAQAAGPSVSLAQVPATGLADDPRIILFLMAILGIAALLSFLVIKLFRRWRSGLALFKTEFLPEDISTLLEKAIRDLHILIFGVPYDNALREKIAKEIKLLQSSLREDGLSHQSIKDQIATLANLLNNPVAPSLFGENKCQALKESLLELKLALESINTFSSSRELEMATL